MVPTSVPNPVVSFDDESLIIVNENNQVLDYQSKLDCHQGEGVLHRAFSIFIFDRAGHLLLQKRSAGKALWPLYWSNSCCSHPRKGESVLQAATRRLKEELDIVAELNSLFTFQYHARFKDIGSEREICEVYFGQISGEVTGNDREIEELKWMDIPAFEDGLALNPDQFTPWLLLEWTRIRERHWDDIESMLTAEI